jgi:tRNA(fMet)-specific endonuclease VapC
MICADTNAVIAFLKRAPDRLVVKFDEAIADGRLALPAPVLFELCYGIAKGTRLEENRERLALFLRAPVEVLPFGAEDAREAGEIRALLERAGTPIGPYDVLIAAQARRRGATLVTANGREFERVPGLRVEDWVAG